ncbi:hypothetical protein PLICRDRAFT_163877 [Plicaturopsis crispa FD-325 SS-3]|nr:hypothetical protein PLICRDRAFT_163877 [Plicaturopsis crispa FD-325 SS-3]
MANRVDTHFHIVPPQFEAAIVAAGGDPSGWNVPEWSPASASAAMDTLGVAKGVLSCTAPGPAVAGNGEAGRKLARAMNEHTKVVVDQSGGRFGWFASLPDFTDVQGAVAEVVWALGEAKADGVVILTSYQGKYVLLPGHASFQPIWDKLNDFNAIVFVHPTSLDIAPALIGSSVPQPVFDYPQATTRAAVDLVVTKTLTTHPNVKVILSHAGGTLPFLLPRATSLFEAAPLGIDSADFQRQMQQFWVDVALSTSKGQLLALLEFTTPDKILFGSDWPYMPLSGAKQVTQALDEFVREDPSGVKLAGVDRTNAEKLFGW